MDQVAGYEDHGELGVLRLRGEVDVAALPDLEPAVAQALAVRHATVVVDVTEVPFIDSSGLGVVARVLRHQRQHHGRVVVRGARPAVARTLRLCAMDRAVELEEDGGSASADGHHGSCT